MSTQWMAIRSFQHGQDILTAINTMPIRTKLKLAKNPDREREEAVARARETLDAFLREMGQIIQRVEEEGPKPLLGVDARLRQLARSFAAARKDPRRFRSELFQNNLSRARELLYAEGESDRRELLEFLQELRTLLEEHVNADATRLLREI